MGTFELKIPNREEGLYDVQLEVKDEIDAKLRKSLPGTSFYGESDEESFEEGKSIIPTTWYDNADCSGDPIAKSTISSEIIEREGSKYLVGSYEIDNLSK